MTSRQTDIPMDTIQYGYINHILQVGWTLLAREEYLTSLILIGLAILKWNWCRRLWTEWSCWSRWPPIPSLPLTLPMIPPPLPSDGEKAGSRRVHWWPHSTVADASSCSLPLYWESHWSRTHTHVLFIPYTSRVQLGYTCIAEVIFLLLFLLLTAATAKIIVIL